MRNIYILLFLLLNVNSIFTDNVVLYNTTSETGTYTSKNKVEDHFNGIVDEDVIQNNEVLSTTVEVEPSSDANNDNDLIWKSAGSKKFENGVATIDKTTTGLSVYAFVKPIYFQISGFDINKISTDTTKTSKLMIKVGSSNVTFAFYKNSGKKINVDIYVNGNIETYYDDLLSNETLEVTIDKDGKMNIVGQVKEMPNIGALDIVKRNNSIAALMVFDGSGLRDLSVKITFGKKCRFVNKILKVLNNIGNTKVVLTVTSSVGITQTQSLTQTEKQIEKDFKEHSVRDLVGVKFEAGIDVKGLGKAKTSTSFDHEEITKEGTEFSTEESVTSFLQHAMTKKEERKWEFTFSPKTRTIISQLIVVCQKYTIEVDYITIVEYEY